MIPSIYNYRNRASRRVTVSLMMTAAVVYIFLPTPLFASGSSLEGVWEGEIIVNPDFKLGTRIDFVLRKPGDWRGYIYIFNQRLERHPLEEVEHDGASLTFVSVDTIDHSTFKGSLSGDGKRLTGMLEERGIEYEVVLERSALPLDPPDEDETPKLHSILASGGGELKSRFDADSGHVRMLLFLSPSCGRCVAAARKIKQDVLNDYAHPDLRVYVVWEGIRASDDKQAAIWAKGHVNDSRASHFWAESPELLELFKRNLGFGSAPLSELYLTFSPKAEWKSDLPKPASVMHNNPAERELLPGHVLDTEMLGEAVGNLLRSH